MADDQFPVEWTGRQAVVGFPGHVDISNVSQRLLSVINRGATVLIADMTDTVSCDHSLVDAIAPLAVVHADEAVDHCQAPAAFVGGSGVPPDRTPGTVIVHFDPQVASGAVQPDADHPGDVPQRVGHQLAAYQHGVVDVAVKAPFGQRLADEPTGLADLGRVAAKPAAGRTFVGGSRRHYRSPRRH